MDRKFINYFIAITLILIASFLILLYLIGKQEQAAEPLVQPISKDKVSRTASPEKVNTADWKLYQNKKYGYEMKYPADWEISTLNNVPADDFSAPSFYSSKSYENGSKSHPELMIGNIHKIESRETIETNLPLGAGSDYILIDKKPMEIGGRDAMFVEYFQASYGRTNGKMGKARQQIKVINNGTSYLISIDEEDEDIDVLDSSKLWKNKAIFDAILESFRFLNSNQKK
jgi:hypothetical protein